MRFQHRNLAISLLLISLGATVGCAKILEDQTELERVEATFFYDPTSASVVGAYSVKLPEERLIRRIIVHSLDPIRNTDIYVRTGEHGWIHTRQIKGWLKGASTIDIRAKGDAVRVIPKTVLIRVIKDIEVFAVPKPN